MRLQGIDLRWVFVIVLVLLLLFLDGLRLPWPLSVALGLIAGSYLFNIGWQQIRGSRVVGAKPKVTYWRGERVVLNQPRQRKVSLPPWPALSSAILYLLLGLTTIALSVLRVFRLSL